MTAIRVELELADGQFVSRMLHAGESIGQFQRNVARGSKSLQDLHDAGINVISSVSRADQTTKGFLSTLRDVSIVTGMLSLGISKIVGLQNTWIGSIVKINAEFEKLNFQMRGLARSSDPIKEAGQNVAWLREKALEMPFSLDAITNGFVRLTATGIDPTKGALNALADGLTAFGGGEEQMKRTLIGISQMSGKGVVQMEEMRQQLAEHMPRAMELMARSMGISMSQLIKDIGTGRLASKPALEMFFAELERTFGGRAQQMMQTFSGQVDRTRTQLQLLATSDTIRLNFFDGALKDQLKDLNDFLTSPRAQAYADAVGNAMTSTVRSIRSVIDAVIEFRSEIANVAIAVGYVFGGQLAIKGISAMGAAFAALRNELKLVGVQFGLATIAQRNYNVVANSGAPAMRQAALGAQALSASLRGMMLGVAAFAPWITGVGLAVYAAGQYFGWFGDKVKDSYEDLKQFGAETRKQAEETIAARRQQLEETIRAAEEAEKVQKKGNLGFNFSDQKARADAAREELRRLNIDARRFTEQAGEREDSKMLATFNEDVERKLAVIKSGYDREQIAANEHYDALAVSAREKGESVRAVEEGRREALLKGQKKFHEDQIREIQNMVTWEEAVERFAQGEQKKQSQIRLDTLRSRIRQEAELLKQAKAGYVPLIEKADNPEADFDKGEKALISLKDNIAKVKAEISGTSPELAKLQEMLARNKFGDMGREEVKKLADDIRQATAEYEQFQELLKGQKDAHRDLDSIKDRLFERQMDLLEKQQGRTITEGERFVLRMNNGAYKGLGPASQIAKALEGVYGRLDIAGSKSNQLGETLRTNAFGGQSQSQIQTVNDKLRETALILDDIGSRMNGINFGSFNMAGGFGMTGDVSAAMPTNVPRELSDRMKQAMEILIAKGWSQVAASGIVGNLAGESSLNPNARNKGDGRDGSDSIGMAQWNSGRAQALQQFARQRGTQWNDFRTQIEFIDWELKNNAGYGGGALQMARSPEAASEMFMRKFERPAEWAIQQSGPKRAGYAKTAYQGYNGSNSSAPAQPIAQYDPNLEAQIAERVRVTGTLVDAAEGLTEKENKLLTEEQKQARVDLLKEMKQKADEAAKGVEGTGKNLKKLQDQIRSGDLGSKDLGAPEYKELIEAAKELDRVEKTRADRKSAMDSADNKTAEYARRQIEMAERVKEANARIFDPMEQKSTAAYRSLRMDLERYIADVEQAYGRDTAEYRKAQEMKAQLLQQHRNMETAENAAKWAKETVEINRGLMNTTQQRQLALAEEIARIDADVAAFKGSEDEKVAYVAAAEAKKAALRAQAAAAGSPVTTMMQQWSDIQTNLASATTNWMNSLADGVTNLIMGTGDLRGVIQGILKDVVNMGVKWMMSQIWSGMGNKGGSAAGKGAAGKGKSAFTSKGKGKAGVMHTGGIVGAASVHRAVSPGIFTGAQKYHTGGIIGGPKLSRGEVPIIAQEGEGVFTPEQMSALGGFNQTSFQISAPVTVNGSSGTPEQNDDLAKRMAKQMEATMRGVVADEMRKQTRPGNFGNSKSR